MSQDVYLAVVSATDTKNEERPEDNRIKLVSESTVGRRIAQSGQKALILGRPLSRLELQAEQSVQRGPEAEWPLQRIEIDDTKQNLFVVDTETRLPVGRPTLTMSQDNYTRMPFGWRHSFEPPSLWNALLAIRHGILEKPDYQSLYKTQHSYPVFGLFDLLVTDRAKHYMSPKLGAIGKEVGFLVEHVAGKTPWFKGKIERFFQTHQTGLIHGIPGTTLSGILELGDFDPVKDACISLAGLEEITAIFFTDYYPYAWHKGIEDQPIKRWEKAISEGFEPFVKEDVRIIEYLLLPSEERKLGRGGIEFETLIYNNADIPYLRSHLKGKPAIIRWNPANIKVIYVFIPDQEMPFIIPLQEEDEAYGGDISLYQHQVIKRLTLKRKGEVNIHNLAEAKRHIQQVVEREFLTTKHARGRMRAIRLLQGPANDTSLPSSLPKTDPEKSGNDKSSANQKHADDASENTPEPSLITFDSATHDDEIDMTGFSGDLIQS